MMIVITGGPSVGKSTLLGELRRCGYAVVPEQATQVIKEGRILPWEDRDRFQREVLRRQLEAEQPFYESNETVFVDRGLLDGEAYYLCDGITPPETYSRLTVKHYSRVLLLVPIGLFVHDGIRFEDLEFTEQLTEVLDTVYSNRGFEVIRIPADTVASRTQFALAAISQRPVTNRIVNKGPVA